MNELVFIVEETPDSGYQARALTESIFTEAGTLDDLHRQVRDAVQCHFEPDQAPKAIRLHFPKGRGSRF